jgi:transposase InsO family protein
MDNIFIARLWRSLKYEEVYLHTYASVAMAKAGSGAWLTFYNEERQYQSLGYRTPRQIYEEGLLKRRRRAPVCAECHPLLARAFACVERCGYWMRTWRMG